MDHPAGPVIVSLGTRLPVSGAEVSHACFVVLGVLATSVGAGVYHFVRV
jgi:hypothetical protein